VLRDDPISAKTVVFGQFDEPAMQSGNYLLTLDQAVQATLPQPPSDDEREAAVLPLEDNPGPSISELYRFQRKFSVLGPRFSLPAASLSAFFPPANGSGDYDDVMPHASLTESSLPWQRSAIDGGKDAKSTPWLALLLFGDGVTAPKSAAGAIGDLQIQGATPFSTPNPLPADTVSYGGRNPFILEPGSSPDDPCRFIDIPMDDFAALAPSPSELPWLAHTREVRLSAALTESADEAPGRYATLCSNRMVSATAGSWTAFVVSLEKLSAFLPADDTYELDATQWKGFGRIRLAVLAEWSFSSQTPKETFSGYLENLASESNPRGLSPLAHAAPANDGTPAAAWLAQAYSAGYCLLPHHTRLGVSTASLLRGPLLPYAPPALSQKTTTLDLSADSCVRLDPAHGIMDMSLPCAWQLGRLSALQDPLLSSSMQAWKRKQVSAAQLAQWGPTLLDGLLPDALALRAQLDEQAPLEHKETRMSARDALQKTVPLALQAALRALAADGRAHGEESGQ